MNSTTRIASMSDLAQAADEAAWANGDDPDLYVQHIPFHGAVDISDEVNAANIEADDQARTMAKLLAQEAAMKERQVKRFIRERDSNKHGGMSGVTRVPPSTMTA